MALKQMVMKNNMEKTWQAVICVCDIGHLRVTKQLPENEQFLCFSMQTNGL